MTGVIVGRFQTPYLHEGHLHLINTALNKSNELVIFIGDTQVFNPEDERNPYSYKQRRDMVKQAFPNVRILKITDVNDNNMWCNILDTVIRKIMKRSKDVRLYGSRDSFLVSYNGKYQSEFVEEIPGISATMIRNELKNRNGN